MDNREKFSNPTRSLSWLFSKSISSNEEIWNKDEGTAPVKRLSWATTATSSESCPMLGEREPMKWFESRESLSSLVKLKIADGMFPVR